jgi:replicative DNA helicase
VNGEYSAAIVAAKKTMRSLIEVAGQIAALAYTEPDEEPALAQAEQLLAAVRARMDHRHDHRRETSSGLITAPELLTKTLAEPAWAVP